MATAEASAAALDILNDLDTPVRSHQVCHIEVMRQERPDLAEQFDRALAHRKANPTSTPRLSDRRIAAWLTERGYVMNHSTVQRHRTGECVRCQTTS